MNCSFFLKNLDKKHLQFAKKNFVKHMKIYRNIYNICEIYRSAIDGSVINAIERVKHLRRLAPAPKIRRSGRVVGDTVPLTGPRIEAQKSVRLATELTAGGSNLNYTRRITLKRVTSCGARLRGIWATQLRRNVATVASR